MNYIHWWLLLSKLAASAALFKDEYPVIMEALDFNDDYHQWSKRDHNLWLPDNEDERKDTASGHDMRRICENLFSFYETAFTNENLHSFADEELQECGKANTTKMKNATKAIRAKKGSVETPGRRKRIIINDADQSANANHTEYPWTVYIRLQRKDIIYYEDPSTGADTQEMNGIADCTGMVIHRRFILTAAHCIESRRINVNDDIAIKSPEHSDHEEFKNKYLKQLNIAPGTNRITVTGVFSNLVSLTIYYGPILIDSNTGDATNLDPNHHPITVDGSNVEVHGGYINAREFDQIEIAKVLGNYQDQRDINPPFWSANDVAIIYLPPGKELTFTEKVRPVCLPAPAGNHQMPDFKKCSMRYGEEFHIAGYGLLQENPRISANGLSRLRAKVREIDFHPWSYYGSNYGGMPRSFQFRNMSRKLKKYMQEALGPGQAGVVALREQ